MEAADIAEASKVWESLNIGIEGKPFQLLGAGQVDTKADVLHRPFFPLAGEVTPELQVLVALAINLAAMAIGQAELSDSGLLEAEPLTGIEIGITIAVFPDGQFSPGGIGLIDNTIVVVIQISQCLKPVSGCFTVAQQGEIAKQLGAGGDLSAWLEIPNQQAIIGSHPAALLGEAIAVMVKVASRCLGEGFDAIAIEIEDDGVASLPFFS